VIKSCGVIMWRLRVVAWETTACPEFFANKQFTCAYYGLYIYIYSFVMGKCRSYIVWLLESDVG